jgi:outer membrane protein
MRIKSNLVRHVLLAIGLWCAASATWAKTGVVDTAKVVEEYSTIQAARNRGSHDLCQQAEALRKTREQLQRRREALAAKQGTVSLEQFDALNAGIQRDEAGFQARWRDYQDALRASLLNDIKEVVAKIAKAEKYDVVLDEAGVLFGGEDITYKVLDQLSKQ